MGGHNLQYLPPKIIYRAIRDMEYQEPRLLRNVFWPYIDWKMNPQISYYQRAWRNKYTALQWHTMMLFWIRNFIQHFTNIVTDELNEIKKDIRIEKAKERKYKNEMKLIDRVNSGAAGAAKVWTDSYKLEYAGNLFIVLGILAGLYTISIIFGVGQAAGSEMAIQGSPNMVPVPQIPT